MDSKSSYRRAQRIANWKSGKYRWKENKEFADEDQAIYSLNKNDISPEKIVEFRELVDKSIELIDHEVQSMYLAYALDYLDVFHHLREDQLEKLWKYLPDTVVNWFYIPARIQERVGDEVCARSICSEYLRTLKDNEIPLFSSFKRKPDRRKKKYINRSPEHIERIASKNRGQIRTDEQRRNISEGKKRANALKNKEKDYDRSL